MPKPKTCLHAITASFLLLAVLPPASANTDSHRVRGPDTWITNPITEGQLFVDIPNTCHYNLENPECTLGSRIRLGAKVGGNYHAFFFESPPSGANADLIKWTGQNGTKCLDVANGGTGNGTPVVLWGCHGGPNQQWVTDEFYSGPHKGFRRLVSVSSGRCLDVENGSYPNWPPPNAPLQIWDCFSPTQWANNRVNQVWQYKRR
ncbi:RICIN domain-containing protein [Nonomuraea sp. NPDC049637]|uniref:RICIN domain-containing protein n=1 Tax=Nonomuraea sp. NPDC049637 TaxID=3154356 RepID=UPI0034357826